jgi:hypothetical protein
MSVNLKLFIFQGRNAGAPYLQEYRAAYTVFKTTWTSAFRELFGQDFAMYSNEFTRQDKIIALFTGQDCVGLTCMRNVSLHNPAHREDSWFKPWTDEDFRAIACAPGQEVVVNSFFTIEQKYRKSLALESLSASYILGCLSLLELLNSPQDTMLGMMRTDRSMQKLGHQWGSLEIQKSVLHNGIATDLVQFTRESLNLAKHSYHPLVFDIWNRRSDFLQEVRNNEIERVA